MKRPLLLPATTLALFLALTPPGVADDLPEILALLRASRVKLLTLVDSRDPGQKKGLIDELSLSQKEIDQRVTALLDNRATPPATRERLERFKKVWEPFKSTRMGEIIPAVLAGDRAKSQSLGKGIQAERFQQMVECLR
ncbi:MAG: hypothetical protein HQL97_14585 [Magnetococcales bacterium]|nr:hypothetical protein [Magnetococcales bacterium]